MYDISFSQIQILYFSFFYVITKFFHFTKFSPLFYWNSQSLLGLDLKKN